MFLPSYFEAAAGFFIFRFLSFNTSANFKGIL